MLTLGKEIAAMVFLIPFDREVKVVPPSVVLIIVPKSPTAQPVVVEINRTPNRSLKVWPAWANQETPPFVVLMIVPYSPMTQPFNDDANWSPNKLRFVPLVSGIQVAPPLLVLNINPNAPTAKPTEGEVK